MHRSLYISAALFIGIVISWFGIARNPTSAQDASQRQHLCWEYQELEMRRGHFDNIKANKLGAKGWELVTVLAPPEGDPVFVLVFKRPK